MPSTRPRVSFDKDGFCNGCVYNRTRKEITNWDEKKRELVQIIDSKKTKENELVIRTVYDYIMNKRL